MVVSDLALLGLTLADAVAIFFHYSTSLTLEAVKIVSYIVIGIPLDEIDWSQLWYPRVVEENREIIGWFWAVKWVFRFYFIEVLSEDWY